MIRNFLRKFFKFIRNNFLKYRIIFSVKLNNVGFNFNIQEQYYKIDNTQYQFYKIPGFTSPNERNYLYNYSKRSFRNRGCIVELGCAFGSLTVPVLQGLREQNISSKIHVYDLFRFHESFGRILEKTGFEKKIQSGESFEYIFKHYTKGFEDLIEINNGDIASSINFPKPIELLVIDAMKSEYLAMEIVKKFYPSLIHDSLVFHQDFCHYHEPWIHLLQYKYKEFFTPLFQIEDTSTFLFRCKKQFKESDIQNLDIMSLTNEFVEEAFEHSLSLVSDQPGNQNIEACKIFCFMLKHEFETACELIDSIVKSTNHIEKGNLSFVIKIAESIKGRENEIIDHYEKNEINLIDDLNFITSITYSS
jgi:hypothetical protein